MALAFGIVLAAAVRAHSQRLHSILDDRIDLLAGLLRLQVPLQLASL